MGLLGKGFVKKKKEEKAGGRFRRFSARARADFWGGGVGWRENNEGWRTVGQKRKRQITIGVVRLQNHPNCTFRPPQTAIGVCPNYSWERIQSDPITYAKIFDCWRAGDIKYLSSDCLTVRLQDCPLTGWSPLAFRRTSPRGAKT